MKQLSVEQKLEGVLPFLTRAGLVREPLDEQTRKTVRDILVASGDRLAVFSDILLYAAFFFRDPVYDPDAIKKRLQKAGMPALVREFAGVMRDVEPFDPPTLEARVRAFCEAKGVKFGDLNHALRVATTGVMVGVGVFETLTILGRDEALRRIDMALASQA
jgi:glutamyl-tRNA synthetase